MEKDDIYAAGVIDGEGTITLARNRKNNKWRWPVVDLPNTCEPLGDWFVTTYGGCKTRKKTYQEHHAVSWTVHIRGNAAIALAKRLLPHLKHPEKIYRAKMLIDNYKRVTPRNGKYTAAQEQAKRQFEHDFFHPSTP